MKEFALPCFYAFAATLAFGIVMELRKGIHILWAGLTGASGWLFYLLLEGHREVTRALIATIVVAAMSEILARVFKTPATVFLMVGMIPLVPGGGIYYTLEALIQGNMSLFVEKGMGTVAFAGAMAVGCSLVAAVVRIITGKKRRRQQIKDVA